jgi:hypothetical protein
MSQENEIILKHSIPVNQENGNKVQVNKLEMGRFKLRHLKLLPDDFVEKEGKIPPADMIPLIAGMMNISEESAGEIDLEDIEQIAEKLVSFLAQSPVITKT